MLLERLPFGILLLARNGHVTSYHPIDEPRDSNPTEVADRDMFTAIMPGPFAAILKPLFDAFVDLDQQTARFGFFRFSLERTTHITIDLYHLAPERQVVMVTHRFDRQAKGPTVPQT